MGVDIKIEHLTKKFGSQVVWGDVTLTLPAVAPPDALYKGDRLGFKFQRTVSRLTEMQSEEYLASEHRP